ncbi:hypothetical protein SNARM312S_06035 [Streptomyces narbonensis]
MLALRTGRRRAAGLRDPRPQSAGGAELGDGQELVGGGRVAELQLAEGLFDGQAVLGECPQVGDTAGERTAELLRGGASGLVVRQGVHGHGPHLRVGLRAAPRQSDGSGEAVAVVGPAGPGLGAERVGAEVAGGGLGSHAATLVDREQLVRGGRGLRSGVEGDRGQVEVDALEDPVELGHRHTGRPDGQPERRDAVLQVGEDHLGIGGHVPLAHVPAARGVALRPSAAYERGEAGKAGIGGAVGGRVQGAGAQAVLEGGGQGVLGLGVRHVLARPAQHARDEATPLVVGRCGELGGQGKAIVRQHSHASDAR